MTTAANFWTLLCSQRFLVLPVLGFASGLPALLSFGTLQARALDEGASIELAGYLLAARLPYSLKFLWAPLLDSIAPPCLGRRRGWMLISSICVIALIAALGSVSPAAEPLLCGIAAALLCFASATQDIVFDAHRRDTLSDKQLGPGSALFIAGYRVGMLFSGAGALGMAAAGMTWPVIYFVMAAAMLPGLAAVLLSGEPPAPQAVPWNEAYWAPLKDFFTRVKSWHVIVFIILFKLGDYLAEAMSVPFLLDHGYSTATIAWSLNTAGLTGAILGVLAGGALMLRWSLSKALWIFAGLQMLSTLGFMLLALLPPEAAYLSIASVVEKGCGGMGAAAFTAFLLSLTNRRYSAGQYAALSSLMIVPSVILGGFTGKLAELLGWQWYFFAATAAAIPALLLLPSVAPIKTTPGAGERLWNSKKL